MYSNVSPVFLVEQHWKRGVVGMFGLVEGEMTGMFGSTEEGASAATAGATGER